MSIMAMDMDTRRRPSRFPFMPLSTFLCLSMSNPDLITGAAGMVIERVIDTVTGTVIIEGVVKGVDEQVAANSGGAARWPPFRANAFSAQ